MTQQLHPLGAPSVPLAPVEATLARLHDLLPAEVDSARSAMAHVLAPVLASGWPEVADRFSVLTNTGLPVELAWTSADQALRWTSEVGPPELDAAARPRVAAHLARCLAGAEIDVGPWTTLQHGSPLRYGCWLGVRHRGADRAAKLYVELPSALSTPSRALPVAADGRAALRACEAVVDDVVWRMAGLHDDGTVELYARAPRLDVEQLSWLATLLPAGGAWRDAVDRLLPVPGLPRPSGFSVTLDPRGGVAALTWFGFAKALWRDDAVASRALRARAGSAASRALHDALARGTPDGRWRHAMVGVGCDAAGHTWVQAGLRPT